MRRNFLLIGMLMLASLDIYSRSMSMDNKGDGCVSCHIQGRVPTSVGSDDIKSINDILQYTDEQYKRIAKSICLKLDRQKDNAQAYTLRRPKMCIALPRECKTSKTHIDSRGIVRYTIATVLKIKDSKTLEDSLPAILSNLLKYNCEKVSSHALPDLPFDQVRRNIMKRAVFTGQITDFFNRFIFKDYEQEDTNGYKSLAIDINAVELVEGKPETILDYLDKVLAPTHDAFLGKARRDDIEDLRQMLINRGAKRASELN